MRWVFIFLLAPLTAAAEGRPAMTGADFRAYAEGYTLHFEDESGRYFGSEQYFPDGHTVWRPRNGECERGVWAEDQGRICFLYVVGIACWKVYVEDEGLSAVSANGDAGEIDETPTRLRLRDRNQVPVSCDEIPSV